MQIPEELLGPLLNDNRQHRERVKLIDQLVLHEGEKLKPYMDTMGLITIGVGRNLSDVGISREESRVLLAEDIDAVLHDLSRHAWYTNLDPVRQRVIADMRFNLGHRIYGFKRMIRMLEAGDYMEASQSMRKSLWAQQVKSRATRLIQMMRTGEDYDEANPV